MIIPFEMLDEKTLHAVIEEFVTRDGTEFSEVEEKIVAVKAQLKRGEVKIAFDEESESCNIIFS